MKVYRLEKSRKHAGLKDLRPTNPLYKALLSYRFYRMENSSLDRMPQETGKVDDCIKRMVLLLRNHYFSGENPIFVLHFLARFVSEADTLGMGEGQAYVVLLYFLRGVAEDPFLSIRGSFRASEGQSTC